MVRAEVYNTLGQNIQPLDNAATRMLLPGGTDPSTLNNHILRVAAELGMPVTVRRVPGGLLYNDAALDAGVGLCLATISIQKSLSMRLHETLIAVKPQPQFLVPARLAVMIPLEPLGALGLQLWLLVAAGRNSGAEQLDVALSLPLVTGLPGSEALSARPFVSISPA